MYSSRPCLIAPAYWIGRLLLTALMFAAVAGTASAAEIAPSEVSSFAAVQRDGLRWSVDYRLTGPFSDWYFPHSGVTRETGKPWRPGSWKVLTQGVILERRGEHDVLRSADGSPLRRVRIEFRPHAGHLIAEDDPAFPIGPKALALDSGQFELWPVVGAAKKNAANAGGKMRLLLSFVDRGATVLFRGRRHARLKLRRSDGYVLFGQTPGTVDRGALIVMDPALPTWIRAEIESSVPWMLDGYQSQLGRYDGDRPTLLVRWAGPSAQVSGLAGGAVSGVIIATFEGADLASPNAPMRDRARWFLAHELAHLWLGEGANVSESGERWITEGGAELLAARAVEAMDPQFDATPRLQRALVACAASLAKGGLAGAGERGDNNAYYSCGLILNFAAESASGRPFPHFVALLRARARGRHIGVADWLRTLERDPQGAAVAAIVGPLLASGTPNPNAALAKLLAAAGIPHRLAPDGSLVLNRRVGATAHPGPQEINTRP